MGVSRDTPTPPKRRQLPVLAILAILAVLAVLSVLSVLTASRLAAQGAIDPTVADRAAALERGGARGSAIELLGRYLATAPDDGRAWLELGLYYLRDGRDWHRQQHASDPDAGIYLDFAATAFDQAIRLGYDTARVERAIVEMDRAITPMESGGWLVPPGRGALEVPPLPAFVLELGRNLVRSCPVRGVLVTGSDLEAVAAWYAVVVEDRRQDVLLIRPELYTSDAAYRAQAAKHLEADSAQTLRTALQSSAGRRPLCLSPLASDSLAPQAAGPVPWRLILLAPSILPGMPADPLAFLDLMAARRGGGQAWSAAVLDVYRVAARRNALLCAGQLSVLDTPGAACGP
jgi:tetratricopeptide (TPR) repeat protein